MEINKFLGTLQHAVEGTWSQHLMTNKYHIHDILNDFYEDMLDAVDNLIEHYMGLHGKVEDLTNEIEPGDDPIKYLESLRDMINDNYDQFSESELQGDLDEIKSVIDSALYKLHELHESRSLKSYLENYLIESLIK